MATTEEHIDIKTNKQTNKQSHQKQPGLWGVQHTARKTKRT